MPGDQESTGVEPRYIMHVCVCCETACASTRISLSLFFFSLSLSLPCFEHSHTNVKAKGSSWAPGECAGTQRIPQKLFVQAPAWHLTLYVNDSHGSVDSSRSPCQGVVRPFKQKLQPGIVNTAVRTRIEGPRAEASRAESHRRRSEALPHCSGELSFACPM